MSGIFGYTLEKAVGILRKSEQNHELYTSANRARKIRTMRVRWRGLVAWTEVKEVGTKFRCKYLMQSDHVEGLGVDWRIV